MPDPDGRTHSPVCWRGHEDCAERLLSEAADALSGLIAEVQDWWETDAAAGEERALLVRLRAALEE